MVNKAFIDRLADPRPLVLDGGLATRLEAMGFDIGTKLWSARLLIDDPQAIVRAHRSFLEAGAECVISASYQASREGFATLGLDDASADELIRRSVSLAQEACRGQAEQAGLPRPALVAASVGPWGATRHDGSEYTGRYAIETSRLADFHRQRTSVLDDCGADVLACETIPSRREALVLAEVLESCLTPAWMSFSCRSGTEISDGTPIREVAAEVAVGGTVCALGVNCTAPRHVESLVREIRRGAPRLPILVYPNSGERYDAQRNLWRDGPGDTDFGVAAARWRDAGAWGIGGCCRTGPGDIEAIRKRLEAIDS